MLTKRKMFFAWQMEKEKQWLEDHAKRGYVLKDIKAFKYTFEKQDPIELVYQFDFQVLSKEKEQEYLELLKDWTLVKRYGGWYYFYKVNSDDSEPVLYSDNASKKALYVRLVGFLLLVGFPLYYQIFFMYPNMDENRFEYPNFYFFMRIIVLLFLLLHTYAILRILNVYIKYKHRIKE